MIALPLTVASRPGADETSQRIERGFEQLEVNHLTEQGYDAETRGLMHDVLSALLLLAAGSAWAGVEQVAEAGDTVFYVDPASVGDKGDFRRVSVIQDYAKQEPGGVRSRRVMYEIDCTGERLRSLSVAEHSEPMAQGSSVNSWQRESEWLYIAPRTGSNVQARTPYKPIVRFVCSR